MERGNVPKSLADGRLQAGRLVCASKGVFDRFFRRNDILIETLMFLDGKRENANVSQRVVRRYRSGAKLPAAKALAHSKYPARGGRALLSEPALIASWQIISRGACLQ